MATIRIENLTAGLDLISDEESYLNYLVDDELNLATGGATPGFVTTVIVFSAGAGASAAVTLAGKAIYNWLR